MAILIFGFGACKNLAANSEKITIRLTPDQVESLDSIMLDRDIDSRSQVIRMAIESFISENLKDVSSQKVVLHLPNNTVNRLIDCISSGDILSIESGIQIAVDRHISSIEDYYLTKREQLSAARSRFQKEVAERLAANQTLKK